MIAVVAGIVAAALVALYAVSLLAARAGVLVIHFRKPPKPRQRPATQEAKQ